jgi:hypothetical protein
MARNTTKAATTVAVGSTSVTVGCKLPHGIILDHPLDPDKKVALNGKNKALIIGADYGTTEVDGEFWETWKTVHKDFPAVRSGAIFEAKNATELVAVAKELEGEKTGFEAMPQTAQGVKPADKE